MDNTKRYIELFILSVMILFSAGIFGCGELPPSIVNITVSPATVSAGSAAVLSCEATSLNGQTLSYTWSVNGGSLSSTNGKTVTWTSPATAATYTASVVVSDGTQNSTATVSIVVAATNAPVISSLTASPSTVEIDKTSVLSCEATDPNGKTLTYTWSAASGTLSGTSGKNVTWTAPSTAGSYQVTLQVKNDLATTTTTVELVVASAPTITSLTALPTSITIEATSVITCVATDAGGRTLTYSWEANTGSVSSTTGTSVTYTAPGSAGTAMITVHVSNGLLTTSASVNIPITTVTAPVISARSATPTSGAPSAEAGWSSALSVTASDPNGRTLTYAWTASPSTGSFTFVNNASTTWTSPVGVVAVHTPFTITCTVSNGSSSTTATFTLTSTP